LFLLQLFIFVLYLQTFFI